MPPVRTLTPSVSKSQDEAAPTAALAIPSWASTAPAIPEDSFRAPGGPYVGQLQPNTGKRPALVAAGCADGDFYLDEGGTVTPLKQFRFWLLQAAAFRTVQSATGDVVSASRDMSDKSKGDEHIVTLIVVDAGGRLVPAKADFRRAQWQAASAAIEGVRQATSVEFPKMSDAARVAAQFPAPFGRVTTTVSVQKKVSRTSGKSYFVCSGTTAPTSVTDMQRLADALKSDAFITSAEAAQKSYAARVEMLTKKCG
jgi:hypothetical protein